MTQEFEGEALTLINAQYGLSGVDAEQQTFLDDGNVSQVIQMKDSARRARAPFQRGYFHILLSNEHGIASTLESFVDPYSPINVANGYPASVDPDVFEIWIADAQVLSGSGGNVAQGLIGFNRRSILQGPSDTAAGGGVTPSSVRIQLGIFDDWAISDGLGIEYGSNSLNNELSLSIRRRWLPGEPLLWRTTTTGAATVIASIQGFIGPVGLGQDLW